MFWHTWPRWSHAARCSENYLRHARLYSEDETTLWDMNRTCGVDNTRQRYSTQARKVQGSAKPAAFVVVVGHECLLCLSALTWKLFSALHVLFPFDDLHHRRTELDKEQRHSTTEYLPSPILKCKSFVFRIVRCDAIF